MATEGIHFRFSKVNGQRYVQIWDSDKYKGTLGNAKQADKILSFWKEWQGKEKN